jgi:hypothetical protein
MKTGTQINAETTDCANFYQRSSVTIFRVVFMTVPGTMNSKNRAMQVAGMQRQVPDTQSLFSDSCMQDTPVVSGRQMERQKTSEFLLYFSSIFSPTIESEDCWAGGTKKGAGVGAWIIRVSGIFWY